MLGSTLAKNYLRDDNQIRKLVEDVYTKFTLGLKNRAEINTDELNIDDKYQEWVKRTEESNIIKNSSLDKYNDQNIKNDASSAKLDKINSSKAYNIDVNGSEPAIKASVIPEYERPETAGNMGVVSKTN